MYSLTRELRVGVVYSDLLLGLIRIGSFGQFLASRFVSAWVFSGGWLGFLSLYVWRKACNVSFALGFLLWERSCACSAWYSL